LIPQNRQFIFDKKDLLQSLFLVLDQNDISKNRKKLLRKELNELYKQNQLFFPSTDPVWLYRLCAAELMQGRYHWFGYEARSNWSWELATGNWFYPRWDGQQCKLLIIGEQGIGDEILFSSCYHELIRDNPDTIFECDNRLIPIFERSFDANFVSRWTDDKIRKPYKNGQHRGEYDAYIPAGAVPKLYRKDTQDNSGKVVNPAKFPDKPYLIPDPERAKYWREALKELGPGPYIGISWQGGPELYEGTTERVHHLPVSDLRIHKQASYVSLQYDRDCPEWCYNAPTQDYDDVIALTAALDRVYTVPTAILHVCGAIGKECHVIKTKVIYADEKDPTAPTTQLRWEFGLWEPEMKWYKSVRLHKSLERFRAYANHEFR